MKGPFHDYLYAQHAELAKKQVFNGRTTNIFARFTGGILRSMGCDSVLDFGSGSGIKKDETNIGHQTLRSLCGDQISLFGYEPSMKESLERDNHQSSVDTFLPFPDNKFDSVMSFDVIEHLHQYDAALIIPEIFRIAKSCIILNISCVPAKKSLPNGKNCHTSVFDPTVWMMMVWQESLRCNIPFALFTTIEKEKYKLIHNMPFKSSSFAFSAQSFANGTFYDYTMNNLREMQSAEKCWISTNIDKVYEYRL